MRKILIAAFLLSISLSAFGTLHPDVALPNEEERQRLIGLYASHVPFALKKSDIDDDAPKVKMESFLEGFETLYNSSDPFSSGGRATKPDSMLLLHFTYVLSIFQTLIVEQGKTLATTTEGITYSPFSALSQAYATHFEVPFMAFQKIANTLYRHLFGQCPLDDQAAVQIENLKHPTKGPAGRLIFLKDDRGALPYYLVEEETGYQPVLYGSTLASGYAKGFYIDKNNGELLRSPVLIISKRKEGGQIEFRFVNGPEGPRPFGIHTTSYNIPLQIAETWTLPSGFRPGVFALGQLKDTNQACISFPTWEERPYANLLFLEELKSTRDVAQKKHDVLTALLDRRRALLPSVSDDSGKMDQLTRQIQDNEKNLAAAAQELVNLKERVDFIEESIGATLEEAIAQGEDALFKAFDTSPAAIAARRALKAEKKAAKKGKSHPKAEAVGAAAATAPEHQAAAATAGTADIVRQKFEQFKQDQKIKHRKFVALIHDILASSPRENLASINITGSHLIAHAVQGPGVTYVIPHGRDDLMPADHGNNIISRLLEMLYRDQV